MGDLGQRVKAAVDATPVPTGLETRVLARVRTARPGRLPWLLPAVGALALAAVLSFVYTNRTRDAYIAQVSSTVPTLMQVGLGDHIHCAVFRKYPKTPPPESLGPKYTDLARIVQKNSPPGYRMLLAHQCNYLGRHFIHVTLGDDKHLLSLVITSKQDAEALAGTQLAAADRFHIAAFESAGYLVYFVSDLPAEQNAGLLREMASAIRGVLEKA